MQGGASLTSAFDLRVQVVECRNCGAPVTHAPAGGQVTCQYCDAVMMLVPRAAPVSAGPTLAPRPEPGADIEYVPDPQRDDWVRATLAAKSYVPAIDPTACAPPDLAPLGEPAATMVWADDRIPALRPLWLRATAQLAQAGHDRAAAHRTYWLATRLALAYAFVATERSGQEQLDLQLRRRAVLETALGLLEGTDYGYALRCQLAQAASQLRDTAAARGWIAPCTPYPESIELDGELRLAMASIYRQESNWPGILGVLGTVEAEIPVYGLSTAILADCSRIHAYEMLGDDRAWSAMLKRAMRRHEWPMIRGACSTHELAPRAKARVLRWILLRLGLIVVPILGLLVGLALLLAFLGAC